MEEHSVQDILSRLAEQVRTRRLLTYPSFKDFDRVRAIQLKTTDDFMSVFFTAISN